VQLKAAKNKEIKKKDKKEQTNDKKRTMTQLQIYRKISAIENLSYLQY